MNQKRHIIIRRMATFGFVLALVTFTAHVFAHGGMEHVMGTVVKVENNVLIVKTAKGNVDIQLNGKTAITSNKQPAQLADLTPGTRVVVDVMGEGKNKVAHSIRLGKAGNTTENTRKSPK